MPDRTHRLVLPLVVVTGVAAATGAAYVVERGEAPPAAVTAGPAPLRDGQAPEPDRQAVAAQGLGLVEIEYVLHRIPTHASNQIAVWIEDERGGYVRTLFATSFTANGGYARRPMSLPLWRETARWESAPEAEVEAASRPAQEPGRHTLYWDGTDRRGVPVPPGSYTYRVEGNLYWENRVLFTGTIVLGDTPRESRATAVHLPESAREHGVLVEDVTARFSPGERLDPALVTTFTRGS
ncbi:hypothetical protein HNP84_003788 [Thermocatellispora tengchongensis]|uniref:DUF2271 domain-containing protein n=1 Tax=Thermocatellispora tengchongensis TaxID=1073253 RepID=A0A840P3X2_9ACTN|nr:DUF2271 domain-containing protein [Thermocatellispora tengchongensis]MBB5134062.1 hypothetical protein [Thermocatellispora tengchongensis]